MASPDPNVVGFDRNDQPRKLFLDFWRGEIAPDELAERALGAWEMAEFPASNGHRHWLEIFAATGFVDDSEWMDDHESPPYVDGQVTVYRGCAVSAMRGFSWTWDREMADWFAQRSARFGFPSATYEVTLDSRRVLAVIGGCEGRTEREVIVNPRRLRGRWTPKEIACFAPAEGEA